MKIEDNHYTYRIETKDSNGGSLDFIDIDTVEPLRCAYNVQDELNLETNEHIKRVEEIVLDANSTEFWYVDEVRTSDTHLVCYFEEVKLMASKDHPMVDTNRSVFEYGKINSNEHQNTNFICTHVMDNGVSRLYMSIDKTIFEFATFNNETIKHFISNNPVTVWYALRYEVIIPRSMSKGHLLTLSGQTDITLTTTSEQAKLPIMKFNIGDTQYTLDTNPIHINNTQEGTQIRNIVLEGNTPINYARGNGVNTTEATSNTRYDFEPFYDGLATIQGTVEGGYVSAKLYGDTMVNIAKPYGETPLLTATNNATLCSDLLGANEEDIVLAYGEITEGRIIGDSSVVDSTIQSVVNPTVQFTNIDSSLSSQATFPYTLNKLPNGVADYIDVVNKVHVQRVGCVVLDNTLSYTKQHTNGNYTLFVYNVPNLPTNTSYRLDNMLCDKLTVENYNNLQAKDNEFITMRNGSSNQLLFCLSNDKASEVSTLQTYLTSNAITVLYELATPIYTPLTDEEIAQLPLSAYADGYVNLSSDQLMPSFEFRMRASNRYQVDMLETGYYYLNAPVGNVKLGTANVDVQQMPCIVKVDNVGTSDSGYRLGFDGEQLITHNLNLYDEIGYLNTAGQVQLGEGRDNVTPYVLVGGTVIIRLSNTNKSSYLYSISYYDENKKHIRTVMDTTINNGIAIISGMGLNVKYIRISMQLKTMITENPNIIVTINSYPITLAKLPSHRIPTTFTQGMKCETDFGYWEGVKESKFDRLWTTNYDWSLCDDTELSSPIQLNRIEYNNTIVEDEFDIATGKLTRRIGKIEIKNITINDITNSNNLTNTLAISLKGIICKNYRTMKCNILKNIGSGWSDDEEGIGGAGISDYSINLRINKNKLTSLDSIGVFKYLQDNNAIVYYELPVPEISYLMPTKNIVKTSTDSKSIQISRFNDYLAPQIKPSHLTYPVPSLVGNRTYTVVHNRKNITGSTKPIELNLGGTVTQLNDASSKTLVKTPSTLAHGNLIFIGGESTVDHIMVLDGDWTNKPIEYFENMMGHDTDAIITIIGNGQINDVEEQYLW